MYGRTPYGGNPYGFPASAPIHEGSASGVVLTVTASIVAGAATGAAAGTGAVSTATATLLDGSAAGGAAAIGAVSAATGSLVDGSATGEAGAVGEVSTATGSLAGGVATGEAETEEALCSAAASLVPGGAAGEVTVEQPNQGSIGGAPERPRPRIAYVSGQIVTARARLITGRAANGAMLPGIVSVSVTAPGATYSPRAEIYSGQAVGVQNWADDEAMLIFLEAA